MGNKIIINASNLHVGGGIQVASSFINELSFITTEFSHIHILASDAVISNLNLCSVNSSKLTVLNINSRGISGALGARSEIISYIKTYKIDAVFSIFGPTYLLNLGIPHLVGFANAWVVNPNKYAKKLLNLRSHFKYLIYKLSLYFESDCIITETDLLRNKMRSDFILKNKDIRVVSNCPSRIYSDKTLWKSIFIPKNDSIYLFCIIANDYIHKNLNVIAEVGEILSKEYGLDSKFIVTIKNESYRTKSENFKLYTINLGPVKADQCPAIYEKSDALFLPTLLETFSANYVEAMAMNVPIFTSKLDFAVDICGDSAFYFEPNSPKNIAAVMFNALSNPDKIKKKVINGQKKLENYPTAHQRAEQYISIIKEFL